jgi:hypothetical protein
MRTKYPGQTWSDLLFDAGQSGYFTFARRYERRQNRHRAKSYCREAARFANEIEVDDDDAYDAVDRIREPEPAQREWKEQRDNLAPLKGFLRAHIGQPWADVYSKLCRRTNRNSMAGDHLMVHLWQYVERDTHIIERDKDRPTSRYVDLYVDDDGILRQLGVDRESHPAYTVYAKKTADFKLAEKLMSESPVKNIREALSYNAGLRRYETERSAAGPRIVMQGDQPYWGKLSRTDFQGNDYYRPLIPLTDKQTAMFDNFHEEVKEKIVYSPK